MTLVRILADAIRITRARSAAALLLVAVGWGSTATAAQPATGASSMPSATPSAMPSPIALPRAKGAQSVDVPGGTTVVVALTEPLSSGTANVGDQVALVVKKEVDVDGMAIVDAGANGHATVTSVTRAGGNGSGGKIAMSVDWVYSVDGGKIPLSQTNHNSENGDNKGAASTATLLSWALLGPIGFFAHNFVRGHDVTIGTDKTFTVFVDHDVHVTSSQVASQSGGYDH